MTRIETIILDLGNTLVPFSLAGLHPRFADHEEKALECFRRAETGQMSPDQVEREISELLQIPAGDFERTWNSIFEDGWLLSPELVRSLKASHRIGILSNTTASHFEFLRRTRPLLGEFDFRVLSYEVGTCKPEAAIFAAAEAQAGCAPEAIFYFDDIPAYAAAASGRGWQAEVFPGNERTAREVLRRHGVL